MQAKLFHTDGTVETVPVEGNYAFVKDVLRLRILIDDEVYRALLVDPSNGRVCWDSDDAALASPATGSVVFAGASS